MKFSALKNGDKVVDKVQSNGKRIDGQVVEYLKDIDGVEYLCSKKSMWPLYQFCQDDYEYAPEDAEVGSYLN